MYTERDHYIRREVQNLGRGVIAQPQKTWRDIQTVLKDHFLYTLRSYDGVETPKIKTMFDNADEIGEALRERNTENSEYQFPLKYDAAAGKVSEDIRVTKKGAFLRKFHLDEMLQVLCIINPHHALSLVGPRPKNQAFMDALKTAKPKEYEKMDDLYKTYGYGRLTPLYRYIGIKKDAKEKIEKKGLDNKSGDLDISLTNAERFYQGLKKRYTRDTKWIPNRLRGTVFDLTVFVQTFWYKYAKYKDDEKMTGL